jgi:hypothetical protein
MHALKDHTPGGPRSPPERHGWTPPRARSASLEGPRSCSHVQAFNALTPQDCATTLTRLGITPRRCSTHSLGKTIPATIQHCADRPVSAPWHCAAYFRTANTPSPRRGDGGTLEWGRMLFLWLHRTAPWHQDGGNGLLHRCQPCAAIPTTTAPRRVLRRHPQRCWSARGQDVATPATVPRTDPRWWHPRAGPPAAAGQPTSTPPPSKPPLYEHWTRHDAPTGARFARTVVNSVALLAMPSHVGEQCGTLVNCSLLGL